MVDFTRYNELLEEIKQLEKEATQELENNGLVAIVIAARSTGSPEELEEALRTMPDSTHKSYIKRRILTKEK